jgi:hypothetical protein
MHVDRAGVPSCVDSGGAADAADPEPGYRGAMIERVRPLLRGALVVAAVAGMLTLTACAPDPDDEPTPSRPAPVQTETAAATGTPTPSPTPSGSPTAFAVPTDCRAILSEAVLAQLGTTPLNDPATGEATGVQADGSLVCLWRDPAADTTYLRTEISRENRGPVLDMLNALVANEGFTCYTPDQGTRCEKTFPNPTYPVTDGRTLFYRGDILIDTQFSNLAPSGYTDSIVDHIFR